MSVSVVRRRSRPAAVVFKLFNPVPFGFFVAALIFDVIYARSGEILWMKSAAWLIAIGLLFAIIPRLVNLGQVWFGRGVRARGLVIDFWLNLLAIIAAIFNAFVHSRDAYAVIPEGLWLSIITVVLLCVASIVRTSYEFDLEERVHA
jgi:uncharacterized membrane protein